MAQGTALLENRLRTLSRELCIALRGAIDSALDAGDRPTRSALRPVQLTAVLGLDKSLASRVVRSLTVEDELLALHGIPTPQGLVLIKGAARDRGATHTSIKRFGEAIASYRELLSEFSGGRTDLEATLAGWIPEQRARADRDARRSVFRGMTTITGTRAGTIYGALYLIPSRQADCLDSLTVGVCQDLRRLRAGARLIVADLWDATADDGDEPRRTTLQGEPLEPDARAIIVSDFCSHPVPDLDLETDGTQLSTSVSSESLDVNESTTLGFGWRTEAHFELHASDERPVLGVEVKSIRPSEAQVFDLFVHEDIELLEPPAVSLREGGGARSHTVRAPSATPGGSLHGHIEMVDLDRAPGGLASADVRACPAIAETVCRESGFMIEQFRTYRSRIEFPLPTERLHVSWRHNIRPQ